MAMILKIINGCAGTNLGILTAGTDPDQRYGFLLYVAWVFVNDEMLNSLLLQVTDAGIIGLDRMLIIWYNQSSTYISS